MFFRIYADTNLLGTADLGASVGKQKGMYMSSNQLDPSLLSASQNDLRLPEQDTVAEIIVDCLVAAGVDHVFGLPGTTIMDVLDALGRRPGIRYLSVRHEQAAVHMADGFWRASGRLAVAMASRGPGASNMAIGIHNAYAESVPLLALVGQVPNAIAQRATFEEMDLVSTFRPMTKWAIEINGSNRVSELLTRAIGMASVGRPRPVLVSVPVDVQGETTIRYPDRKPPHIFFPAPDVIDLAPIVASLGGAQHPVIMLGGGMLRQTFCSDVIELAEKVGAAVVTTWMRKNAFPNSHESYVGSLGFGAHASAEKAVREADVLLALGCRFSEFTTKRYTLIDPLTRIIQVDIDAEEIGTVYPVYMGVAGDAWGVVRSLNRAIQSATATSATSEWRTGLHEEYRAQTVVPLRHESELSGVSSESVVKVLGTILIQTGAILVQDAHSFGPWISRHIIFDNPGKYFAAAGGSMGWGLPAAIGVKAARPDETVVAVCSDGSFWMVAQEFETAVRERLPVVVIVTNNFAFGNTRDRQRHAHGGRYVGVFYDNPDFAAFARSLGGHGERVERDDELDGAVKRACASGKAAIIDVIQNQEEGLPRDMQPLPAR